MGNARSVGVCLAGCLMAIVTQARSEVIGVAANGFEVRESANIAAAPQKIYAALLEPSRWWSSDHTFSHSATNLSLDAKAGGCWCEKLPDGGSVEHMRVLYVAPGKMLRMRGALGPFQALAVDGIMTWTIKPAAEGTELTVSYAVGGYVPDGFDALAKAADRVLGEQLKGLKKLIDGSP